MRPTASGTRQQLARHTLTMRLGASAVLMAVAVGIGVWMLHGSFLAALVAFVAALGVIAAIAATEAALYATIAVACFDGIIKGMYPGAFSMVLKDVFLGLALLHWAWDGVNGGSRGSLSHRVALPTVMLTLYCVAQMFNSETMSWVLALAGLRSWIVWIPVFFITYDTIRTRHQFERLVLFVAVISASTGLYIITQHQIGFGHLYRLSPHFTFYTNFSQGAAIRAPGTYVHPGTAGSAMSFAATICAGVALASRAFSARQLMLLASAVVCLVAMAATGSRAPLIGAVIGLTTFIATTRRPHLIVGLALLAVFGLWQSEKYVGRMMSVRYSRSRLNVHVIADRALGPFTQGFSMLSKYPLGTGVASGVGAGRGLLLVEEPTYVKAEAAVFIENEIGRAMKELGLPGVALFVWLLWRAMASGMAGWRYSTGRDSWLASGLMAGTVNLCVQLMVGSALYLAPGGIYFWMACALASRIPDYEAQDRQALVQRSPEQARAWDEMVRRVSQDR